MCAVANISTGTFRLLLSTLLDDQLIQTQFLCSTLEHTLFDAVLSDEAEDINLLRLADAMSAIHCLQISLRIPRMQERSVSYQAILLLDMYQSLSYSTTISAVVKLIPSPPARVVSKKMNFSLPGLLYSSIAVIRSS